MPLQITGVEHVDKTIPDSTYTAKVIKVDETTGQYPGVKFGFELYSTDQNINLRQVSGTAWFKITKEGTRILEPGDKLHKWLKAFGVDLQPSQTLDLEQLLGRPCYVKIENKPSKDNTRMFSNVVDIMLYQPMVQIPVPSAAPVSVPQPAAVPQPAGVPAPAPQPQAALQPAPSPQPAAAQPVLQPVPNTIKFA